MALFVNNNIEQQPEKENQPIRRKDNNPGNPFFLMGIEMNAIRQGYPVNNFKEIECFKGIYVLSAQLIIIKKVHERKRVKRADVVKVGIGLDKQKPCDF